MATLTISFTSSTTYPTNGYIVKYRQTGTVPYTTVTPNPTTSPVLINSLGSGVSYEGTIQADCGNGQYGTVSTFSATVAARFNVSRDPSSASNACALTNKNFVFYSASAVVSQNTQVYSDVQLSVIFNNAGFYSDGTNVYQISSAGIVLSVALCQIP